MGMSAIGPKRTWVVYALKGIGGETAPRARADRTAAAADGRDFAVRRQHRRSFWHGTNGRRRRCPLRRRHVLDRVCDRRVEAAKFGPARPQGAKYALHEAFQTHGFWLLIIGFFVCGFHVAFIGLHLPSYISDKAVSMIRRDDQASAFTVAIGGKADID